MGGNWVYLLELDMVILVLATTAHAGSRYIDLDGDGYQADPLTSALTDCDDSQVGIYPGAAEVPDNDVDDDCDWQVDETNAADAWTSTTAFDEIQACAGVLAPTSASWRSVAVSLDACFAQDGAWTKCTCEDPDSNGDGKPERQWDAKRRLFRDVEVVALASKVEAFDGRLTTVEGVAADAQTNADRALETARDTHRILVGDGTEGNPKDGSALARLNHTEAEAGILADIVWGVTGNTEEPGEESLIGKVESGRTRLTELERAGAEVMVGLHGGLILSPDADAPRIAVGPETSIGYRWRPYMAGGMGFSGSYVLDMFNSLTGFEIQQVVFLEPRFHTEDLDYVSLRPELGFQLYQWDGEAMDLYPISGLRLGLNGGSGKRSKFSTWRVDVRGSVSRRDDDWMWGIGFGFNLGGAPVLPSEQNSDP